MADLQDAEARARTESRDLRLELDRAGVELRRREATVAARDRVLAEGAERERALRDELARNAKLAAARDAKLAATEARLRELRGERRVLTARNDRLNAQLDAVYGSRAYRFARMVWKIRRGLTRPFRRRGA
jgi:hypothetical protein